MSVGVSDMTMIRYFKVNASLTLVDSGTEHRLNEPVMNKCVLFGAISTRFSEPCTQWVSIVHGSLTLVNSAPKSTHLFIPGSYFSEIMAIGNSFAKIGSLFVPIPISLALLFSASQETVSLDAKGWVLF